MGRRKDDVNTRKTAMTLPLQVEESKAYSFGLFRF